MRPDVLAEIVETAVIKFRNEALWKKAVGREEAERRKLLAVAKKF